MKTKKNASKKVYPRKAKRSSKYVSKSLKTYVKKEINRNIEDKEYTSYAINQSITTAITGTVVPLQINLLPEIAIGTGESNRIGNIVQPMYGILKGQINLLPFNETTNPFNNIVVKMWLVKWKNQNNQGVNVGDSNLSTFFESGPNSTVGFQGNMLDIMLPINKNEWILYCTRTFRLGVGQVSASSTYGRQGTPADNSAYSKLFSIKYVPNYLKQKLHFDTTTERPINTNLRLFIQAVQSDGNGGSLAIPAEIHYSHQFKYQDA